jgi:hypothetical protein
METGNSSLIGDAPHYQDQGCASSRQVRIIPQVFENNVINSKNMHIWMDTLHKHASKCGNEN